MAGLIWRKSRKEDRRYLTCRVETEPDQSGLAPDRQNGEFCMHIFTLCREVELMGKYFKQLTLKISDGGYDEPLDKLFHATLVLAVLVFFTAFCIMYQLGCFEYLSEVLQPAQGIEWPVFPN